MQNHFTATCFTLTAYVAIEQLRGLLNYTKANEADLRDELAALKEEYLRNESASEDSGDERANKVPPPHYRRKDCRMLRCTVLTSVAEFRP